MGRLRNFKFIPYSEDESKNDLHHIKKANDIIKETDYKSENIEKLKKIHYIENNFTTNQTGTKNSEEIYCYTVGSKDAIYTSSGFVFVKGNQIVLEKTIKINENISVFQAEMLTINEAVIEYKKNNKLNYNRKLIIYTDSQSSIAPLNSQNTKLSEQMTECRKKINKIAETSEVDINWIKGHN